MAIMYSKQFINRGVMNSNGEHLGKIKCIAINMESGKIAFAVLAFGGFPNRTKLFTVPWELMRFSSHDRRFIFNIPRKLILTAAGYDTLEEVKAHTDFHWLGNVYSIFSDKPELDQRQKEQDDRDIEVTKKRREEIENSLVQTP